MLYSDKEALKNSVRSDLMFSDSFQYNEQITLYPVTIKNYLIFSLFSQAIIINKNSKFPNKNIIKMSYWDFLLFAASSSQLEEQFNSANTNRYLVYTLALLKLVCKTDNVNINKDRQLVINGCVVDNDMFDDLRRIIILQNDIDYDIDSFMNYETERKLKEAENKLNRGNNHADIEDYIDSLVIALNMSEAEVKKITIRKFWRYIKRINLYDIYKILKIVESSGFVKFKNPIEHWMISLEKDRYSDIKTSSQTIRDKIG